MTDIFTVRKIKLSGAVLTWRAYSVAEDEHGRWTFTSPGTLVHNAKNGEVSYAAMGKGTEPGFLWLMPRDEWWFGGWWTRPDRDQISIDACTPPTLLNGIWTWTDLELDIGRNDRAGDLGGVWVEDEDEFEESIALGLIDEPSQRAALDVTSEMVRRLTERVAPFDDFGWKRYDAVVARHLPPLELPRP
ncbi:MAG TPA: DUF402 domain-containing protein [Acidimicrobiales bacterium]|nr:DUF402 domain-containing protein [Acidimicrobiales bacterium]